MNIGDLNINRKFSVTFPKEIVEELDLICSQKLLSRSAWLLQAARNELQRVRAHKTKSLLEGLKSEI